MKPLARIALFVVIATLSNVIAMLAMPWLISHVVVRGIVASAVEHARTERNDADPQLRQRAGLVLQRDGYNVAIEAAPVNAASRTVVRPSPDLLYTACVFDLSKHALRIRAPVQDSYVSVSGFGADSSNFFARDGRSEPVDASGKRSFDLLLVHGLTYKPAPGAQVIESPTVTGLVLFRSLITSRQALPDLQRRYQARQTCTPQ